MSDQLLRILLILICCLKYNALENNQYVAAVLMDLSKAFDCLPHDILLDKLSACGMSTDSVSLLGSYLSNRKQQIKINSILSSWSDAFSLCGISKSTFDHPIEGHSAFIQACDWL
jgi:hypothetical protein